MKQEELVNKAINILIHGERNGHFIISKSPRNKELWLYSDGLLQYYSKESGGWCGVYFNKKIKNMCLLSVLLKDWCNKQGEIIDFYELWIKNGACNDTR